MSDTVVPASATSGNLAELRPARCRNTLFGMAATRGETRHATCIALLRGINVGKAKRIAMSDLREIVAALGHHNVRTVLNSGNVVFDVAGDRPPDCGRLATAIHQAIVATTGVSASVTVVTAATLDAIVRGNPWPEAAAQASRFLVAFAPDAASLARLAPLAALQWEPDRFALSGLAAYAWCASGLLDSKLGVAVLKASDGAATTRNWATVCKLHEMCG